MSIEQKKIALINWIANLEDEVIIDQLSGFQTSSLGDFPESIIQLLKIADAESEDNLITHTSSKDILKMK